MRENLYGRYYMPLILFLLIFTGCGTTKNFIPQKIHDMPTKKLVRLKNVSRRFLVAIDIYPIPSMGFFTFNDVYITQGEHTIEYRVYNYGEKYIEEGRLNCQLFFISGHTYTMGNIKSMIKEAACGQDQFPDLFRISPAIPQSTAQLGINPGRGDR